MLSKIKDKCLLTWILNFKLYILLNYQQFNSSTLNKKKNNLHVSNIHSIHITNLYIILNIYLLIDSNRFGIIKNNFS